LKEVSRSERFSILEDAFTVEHNEISRIEGRKIDLIDDVMTSGATLSAAANALFRAGVHDISVLVLARVTENT
jgi:predicted amidophosphoribosyltransferase